MARALKIWNGNGMSSCRKRDDPMWRDVPGNAYVHAFVAAFSRADARRVIEEYCGRLPTDSELRDWWSEGAWGTAMAGVEPERGLWLQVDQNKPPVRVV